MAISQVPDFKSIKRVHILGICGTLMGAFATWLKRSGVQVTGSDQNIYPPMSDLLQNAGIQLLSGYSAKNLESIARPDLVIVGNVISATNAEMIAVTELKFPYLSLPEALEKWILPETRNLVVAGTHGKTTTASLLAFTLLHSGRDPSYFIGGVPHDLPYSFQISDGGDGPRYFVIEGDEYDTAFWDKVPKFNHYLPDEVILTSVEFDHADIYKDFDAVKKAFSGLLTRIRAGGHLIACTDYLSISDALSEAASSLDGRKVEVSTYGIGTGKQAPEFVATRIRTEDGMTRFDVIQNGQTRAQLALQIPGRHNVLNALAVWIQAKRIGLSDQEIQKAFLTFRGVKRRQEERGEVGGVLVVDDFAHHPTAVRETLLALKQKYPQRRLITVFEPRSATSRRKVFQNDYAQAFSQSAATFIAVPFDQSKIASSEQFSSQQLVDDLTRLGTAAYVLESVDTGVNQLAEYVQPGDLVAVLSNGGFGGFIPKLLQALRS